MNITDIVKQISRNHNRAELISIRLTELTLEIEKSKDGNKDSLRSEKHFLEDDYRALIRDNNNLCESLKIDNYLFLLRNSK